MAEARSNQKIALDKFLSDYNYELSTLHISNPSFSQLLTLHLREKKCNKTIFCKRTLLSERFFERIMGKEKHTPSRETVLLICISLDIWGKSGEAMFEAAGYAFNQKYYLHKKTLNSLRGYTIYECDEILIANGYKSIIPKVQEEKIFTDKACR